jgi:hypothetical protein
MRNYSTGVGFVAHSTIVGVHRDELCRRPDNSAGSGYVHEGSVGAMKATIEKRTFDGFVF